MQILLLWLCTSVPLMGEARAEMNPTHQLTLPARESGINSLAGLCGEEEMASWAKMNSPEES